MFLAGLSARLATQFKFTFVAALVAGTMWLMARRQWKDLALFVAAGFLASAGLYLIFWLREPPDDCASDVVAYRFRRSCWMSRYCVQSPWRTGGSAGHRRDPGSCLICFASAGALLGGFALISFVIAGLTDLHPGGNINYFFEGLFALVPIAAYRPHPFVDSCAPQHRRRPLCCRPVSRSVSARERQ